MDALMKIPGMDKAADVLRKKGIAGFEGIAKAGSKLGKRAAAILPVIGGLVNLFFAYQRFSQGDSIGGLIEGTSGILDVFGLATGGATSVISMLMDGYMFVRDFVPQLQQGEGAVVDAMGLRGFKDSIDKVLSKLPGLGTIVDTLIKPFKSDEEKEEDKESKKGKKAWWDFAGVFTGKDKKEETKPLPKDKQTKEIKKNQWWDFLDLFPNPVESIKILPKNNSSQSNKSLIKPVHNSKIGDTSLDLFTADIDNTFMIAFQKEIEYVPISSGNDSGFDGINLSLIHI